MKGLEPAVRAEAEAVGAAVRTTLAARDPASPLARSIQIIDLSQGDKPAFARDKGSARQSAINKEAPATEVTRASNQRGDRRLTTTVTMTPLKPFGR